MKTYHIHYWLIFVAHIALALFHVFESGISSEVAVVSDPASSTWGWYWQLQPMSDLRGDLLGTIWNLHAQPPLYNLYGGIIGTIFYPAHLVALHLIHIVLGGVMSALLYAIIYQTTGRQWLAFVIALILALNPSLILYEAYPLYTFMTAFLVVLAVYWMALHAASRRSWPLVALVLTVNLLILTRSSYHVALLVPLLALVTVVARSRRVLVVSLLICLLSVGWYGKNLAQFGFFGGSSWSGFNLWRVASAGYSPDELATLVDEPVVLELGAFAFPSQYTAYGFDRTSDYPGLGRNDQHNINIPDVAAVYGANALRLIRHDPGRYLRTVGDAYEIYVCPSYTYKHLIDNVIEMPTHILLARHALYLTFIGDWLGEAVDRPVCSALFFAIPASLVIFGLLLLADGRLSPHRWLDAIRRRPVMVLMALLIIYGVLSGTMFEIAENDRFKFEIEQIIFAFMAILVIRVVDTLWQHRPVSARPAPAENRPAGQAAHMKT